MELGDLIETAIWLDGRETKEQRLAFEQAVIQEINDECARSGVLHGEVRFTVKHPHDDRVPPVPAHIKTTSPRLLVAEAEIIGRAIEEVRSSFIADIEPKDLLRLRQITMRALAKEGQYINDYEADDIIEALGPVAAEDALRRAIIH